MSPHDVSANLWEQTAGPPLEAEAFVGENKVDVVVIGGGYTGCTAALYLAEAGATVYLLEANTIGFGGSGRNVGLVNAGLWLEPEQVEATLGVSAGARLNEALASGPALVFSLIEKHNITSQLIRAGTLHCAHSRAGLARLNRRLVQYLERGAPVDLLSEEETAARTGTTRFYGALLDHRAGVIQPLAYVRGLAKAAIAAGAFVYEYSPVETMSFDNGVWTVTTPQGVVKTDALVLATNAYHQGLKSDAAPRYTPVYYFQVATRPLSADARASILPQQQGAWDTAKVMTSFRVDSEGRLILGAVGSLESFGNSIHQAWARRKLNSLFPATTQYEFEYAWCGCFAMTGDHIPKIVHIGNQAVSLYGYSGRGIGPATVFGKSVAEYLLTGDMDRLPLTPVQRHRESLCAVKQTYYELGASAFHFLNCRTAKTTSAQFS